MAAKAHRNTRDQLWPSTRDHGGRRSRLSTLGVSAAVILPSIALLLTIVQPPRARLVWNKSSSAPIGLYLVSPASKISPGDFAIAWAPAPARWLGAERHYLPANVPLVKEVAAIAGDHVCLEGSAVLVGGAKVTSRRSADPRGRPMPWPEGCTTLGPRQLFLLSPRQPLAFDGRYFGITRSADVIGKATLLWRG